MTQDAATHVEVAIVGAGPAGSALALRLARRGLQVALLERSHFDSPRVGESLAPSVRQGLVDLGVWPAFLALSPHPSYGTRSVWGESQPQTHSHIVTPFGQGWHVDRQEFDGMLAAAAAAAGACLMTGTRLLSCTNNGHGWSITVQGEAGPAELTAAFVVDATGRQSILSRQLGAERMLFDRLVGIGAAFDLPAEELAGEGYILIESTPLGWWYSAPAGPERVIVMLMTDGDLSRPLRAVDVWRQALQQAPLTGQRFNMGNDLPHHLNTVSAVSQRTWQREGQRPWLAVGDAALAVDPISGSGVIRALAGAQAAEEAVLGYLNGDQDAICHYEAVHHEACTTYLQERIGYYQMEQRWPDIPFWQRRIKSM